MSSVDLMISVPIEIEVRARISVLHDTVHDLVRGFLGGSIPATIEDTIRKGILENQFLDNVSVHYLLDDGTMVGEAEISIDWNKYEASIKTDGETISIEKGRSLLEQISRICAILIQHMDKMSKAFGVTKKIVRYSYRDEIHADKERLAKARNLLGTSPAEPLKWSDKGERDSKGNDVLGLSTTSAVLRELNVKVTSLRRLKP